MTSARLGDRAYEGVGILAEEMTGSALTTGLMSGFGGVQPRGTQREGLAEGAPLPMFPGLGPGPALSQAGGNGAEPWASPPGGEG